MLPWDTFKISTEPWQPSSKILVIKPLWNAAMMKHGGMKYPFQIRPESLQETRYMGEMLEDARAALLSGNIPSSCPADDNLSGE